MFLTCHYATRHWSGPSTRPSVQQWCGQCQWPLSRTTIQPTVWGWRRYIFPVWWGWRGTKTKGLSRQTGSHPSLIVIFSSFISSRLSLTTTWGKTSLSTFYKNIRTRTAHHNPPYFGLTPLSSLQALNQMTPMMTMTRLQKALGELQMKRKHWDFTHLAGGLQSLGLNNIGVSMLQPKTLFLTAPSIYQMLQGFSLGPLMNTRRRVVYWNLVRSYFVLFNIDWHKSCIEYHQNRPMDILASFLLFFSVKWTLDHPIC